MEQNVKKGFLDPYLGFLKNRYFKYCLATITYILWVIWLDNYWFLLGLPIIFDIYISKKVNWSPWKKREGKNSTFIEWLDALIFAVIAVTLINIFLFQNYKIPTGSMEKSLLIGDHLFVSKVSYGPRVPNTPIAFPFAQHTMPLIKTKSYVEWVKWPYKRLAGLDTIENDDIVVFNFPAGDTVVLQNQATSYYAIIRTFMQEFKYRDIQSGHAVRTEKEYWKLSRQYVWDNFDITIRPVDKRDNYIKRCVAIPGDSLKLIDGKIFINGNPQQEYEGIQYRHIVTTKGTRINPKILQRLNIYEDDVSKINSSNYIMPLTAENVEIIKDYANVLNITKIAKPKGEYSYHIFPHDPKYQWNEDNFGPLWIPKAGKTVDISLENISLYKRIINVFENNDLEIIDSTIYINGQPATNYTFKMDYFFMIGDNRHDSADSRFWGFVPMDHIVGRPKFIWLSLDKEKRFLAKVRWRRLFASAE
ncbi:S26 family signal peptidase [Bacteroidota bacterium]